MVKTGDLFVIPLGDGVAVTGQVRLDVDVLFERGLVAVNSRLSSFRGTVLVDMFEGLAAGPSSGRERLVGGFVSPQEIDANIWPLVGHEPFDWRDVAFPEFLTLGRANPEHSVGPTLVVGELVFPLDMTYAHMKALQVAGSPLRKARLAPICAHYSGRDDLVEERIRGNVWQTTVQHKDLRHSEHRQEVFASAGLDPTSSYLELASRCGVDTKRLFDLD